MSRIILFVMLASSLHFNNTYGQTLLDEKRVVFESANSVYLRFIKDSLLQRFTPTLIEINSIDSILSEFLLTKKTSAGNNFELSNFYRQYVGFLLNGRKYIYVNAACHRPDSFLTNISYPKGGGKCYFQTRADLINRHIEEFYFNAPR